MSLTRKAYVTIALLAVVVAVATAHKGEKHTSETSPPASQPQEEPDIDIRTVDGEIIDITCFIRHDSRGPEHLKCALTCAELGMPLGLLENGTGELFLILPGGHSDPRKLVLPYIAKKVRVDGILWGSGGLTGIEIEDIRELGKTEPADDTG